MSLLPVPLSLSILFLTLFPSLYLIIFFSITHEQRWCPIDRTMHFVILFANGYLIDEYKLEYLLSSFTCMIHKLDLFVFSTEPVINDAQIAISAIIVSTHVSWARVHE